MRIGVLLSGYGVGDGSQIEEVILTSLALDKYQIDYIYIAPNKKQFHVMKHLDETLDFLLSKIVFLCKKFIIGSTVKYTDIGIRRI